MARIARGAVIEFSTEIDDLHDGPFLEDTGVIASDALQATRINPDISELLHYLASSKGERPGRYRSPLRRKMRRLS